MATRNATPQFTFEEWRIEFNQLATDVGDIESGITGSVASGASTYTTVETALEALFTDINSIVDGTYITTGDSTINGDLTVTGDIVLGNQNTDTITVNADFGSDLIPNIDDTYDIGSSLKSWQDLFLSGTATLSGVTGSTSDSTGTLIVSGGAGIGENLYVGGNIFENDQAMANRGFAIAVAIALS